VSTDSTTLPPVAVEGGGGAVPATAGPPPGGPTPGRPDAAVARRIVTRILVRTTVGAAVALGAFCALVALATDVGVGTALREFWEGSLGGSDPLAETLTRAIPLGIVGVGAAVALRGGIFNVGGEGQMAIGAVLAVLAVRPIDGAPVALVWLVAVLAGAAGGAAWAVGPALLWARRGVSEILSTLLVNFVTVYLLTWLLTETFLHDPDPYVITAQGELLADRLHLPTLVDGTQLHLGLVAALAVVLTAAWWLRTPAGLHIDLVGANPSLAAQAGLRPSRLRVRLLLGSAAVAGIAGAVQLLGVTHRLTMGLTGGVGYTGLLVAVLGRARPVGTLGAAVLFAALVNGGDAVRNIGVPPSIAVVIQAVVVVTVAIAGRRSAS
jgi:simple sugar transport system permease protein